MKIIILKISLFFFLFITIGCDRNPEDGNFEGVGKLIAARNELRLQIARDKKAQKEGFAQEDISQESWAQKKFSPESSTNNSNELSTNKLHVKEIKIISIEGDNTIAYGKAYFNSKGSLMHIRITSQKK